MVTDLRQVKGDRSSRERLINDYDWVSNLSELRQLIQSTNAGTRRNCRQFPQVRSVGASGSIFGHIMKLDHPVIRNNNNTEHEQIRVRSRS